MLYSTLKDMQALNKINHQANLKYDYSLKWYFRGKFFVQCQCQCQPKVHLCTSRAFGCNSGSSVLGGHSKCTSEFVALRHSSTQGTHTLGYSGHLGTWTLTPSGTQGTYLKGVCKVTCLSCLRAVRAYVLTCPTCLCALRAYVPSCLKLIRAYVSTCLKLLRVYVPRCLSYLRALRAYVPTCLPAFVP